MLLRMIKIPSRIGRMLTMYCGRMSIMMPSATAMMPMTRS